MRTIFVFALLAASVILSGLYLWSDPGNDTRNLDERVDFEFPNPKLEVRPMVFSCLTFFEGQTASTNARRAYEEFLRASDLVSAQNIEDLRQDGLGRALDGRARYENLFSQISTEFGCDISLRPYVDR